MASEPTLPRINDKLGPRELKQGYIWAVNFELPQPANADGFIIQEVFKDRSRKVVEPKTDSFHYWEAWPVKKGTNRSLLNATIEEYLTNMGFPLAGLVIPALGSSVNDVLADMMAIPGSKGSITVLASAKFYATTLPSNFTSNNPKTQAGKLLSSITRPPFWTGIGSYRHLSCEWDYTSMVTKPKVTFHRRPAWQVFGGVPKR